MVLLQADGGPQASPADWGGLAISCFSLLVAVGAFFWAIKRPVWVGRWEPFGPGLYRFKIRNIGEGTARFVKLEIHVRRGKGGSGDGLEIEDDVLPGQSHEYPLGYGELPVDLASTYGLPLMAIRAPSKVWAEVTWHEAPFTRVRRRKRFPFPEEFARMAQNGGEVDISFGQARPPDKGR